MAKYNGHRSWNAWNVSLWIGNDYGLYIFALQRIAANPTKDLAAKDMYNELIRCGYDTTPDGAPYTITSIREAMRGLT